MNLLLVIGISVLFTAMAGLALGIKLLAGKKTSIKAGCCGISFEDAENGNSCQCGENCGCF
jgi:hypothetical protein